MLEDHPEGQLPAFDAENVSKRELQQVEGMGGKAAEDTQTRADQPDTDVR